MGEESSMSNDPSSRKEKSANNPKDDIEALDRNLESAQLNHTAAAEELGYQREIVRGIKPYWDSVTLNEGSPPVVISGAQQLAEWASQSETWRENSRSQLNNITFGSSMASTAAYNAVSMDYGMTGHHSIDLDRFNETLSKRDERDFVEERLTAIDKVLANTYKDAWRYLHLPAFDPMRGPLFLMRQVFDHLLAKLAPDGAIMSQPGFVPDKNVRNGKGITRAGRIQFVAEHRVADVEQRRLVLASTRTFTDLYEELSKAHSRGSLNQDAARNAVYACSGLISQWLRAIESS
jgi:Predicted pPIWI-associating nuclease